MRASTLLGGAWLALLISGCDAIGGVVGEFQPAPLVEVTGALEGACVRLDALSEGKLARSFSSCTAPYTFRVDLPDGVYGLVAQAVRDGLVYQEGRTEVELRKGGRTEVALSRKRVNVQVTAAWLDPARPALAEAWMLPQEAAGVPTYADPPPKGLEGRVLVAREVVAQGTGSLRVPTGRNVAFRLGQGETVGVAMVSLLEEDGRVVVP